MNKPLLARPALPRAVRVGDRFAAGVVLHRLGSGAVPVTVKAKVDGGARGLEALEATVQVPADKGVEVRFPFEAVAAEPAKLHFEVAGGGEADAVELSVPVHWPTARETVATYGDTDGQRDEALLVPAARPGTAKLRVTLASSALSGLGDDAKQLIDYPYGCLEQRTSRLVPFVALKSVLDAYGEEWAGKPAAEVVKETATKLAGLQRGDGGFGYWPGSRSSHYWGTAYAALGLEDAKRAGYDVGEVNLPRARRYLRKYWDKTAPAEWGKRSANEQAFALYVLARAGEPQDGLEQQLFDRRAELANFGKGLLAAATARGGAAGLRAKALVAELMNSAVVEARTVHFADADPGTYAALFSSDTRTTGIVLQALLGADPDHAFVPRIASWLLEARRGGGYQSTQEAAFSLMALSDFAKAREPDAPNFTARVVLAGRTLASERFDGKSLAALNREVSVGELGKGANAFQFFAEGEGRLYYGARLQYVPAEMPTEALDRGIVVQRWYSPESGEGRLDAVTEGALVRVHLRLATQKLRHYVAVEDPLPAGLEAVDVTLATSASALGSDSGSQTDAGRAVRWYSPFDHTEMRDDRVLLFADRLPPGIHTYSYVARATTAGRFAMPGARAEEMYTPEVNGRSAGGSFWIHPRAEVASR